MDTLEYKDLFISESLEHMDLLNQALMSLEKDPTNKQPVNEIFRTSHTLKSMAATMGFDQITELTHQMENVLDKLRTQEGPVTPAIVDVLFECLDTLGVLIEEISTSEPKNIQIGHLLEKLKALEGSSVPSAPRTAAKKTTAKPTAASPAAPAASKTPAAPASQPDDAWRDMEDVIARARQEGFVCYGIRVQLEESCSFKGVRAFMVFKALTDQGEILASVPKPELLQEGDFEGKFLLLMLSKRGKEILERGIRSIAEIESYSVDELSTDALHAFLGESQPEILPVEESQEPTAQQKSQTQMGRMIQSIRVSIDRLDNLQNLVGELVINKIRLTQLSKQHELKDLKEALTQFDRITNELQDEVTVVRMVPMEHIFNRFPRMVRDLAKEGGKEIDLVMEGKEIELDRTVLDEINDPLVHLLRNAVDHGIETPEERLKAGKERHGLVRLVARREKNHVIIQVQDNGRGINHEEIRKAAVEKGLISSEECERLSEQDAINLIVLPGMTTAKKVTEVSGRGVGVDAVRTKIESFGGSLKIESQVGKGSNFVLRMPLTLAIIQALLFRLNHEVYALPVVNAVETLEFQEADVRYIQQGEVVIYRDNVLPLVRLHKLLGVPGEEKAGVHQAILVSEVGDMRIGLLVDEVIGQQEIAIKSLGALLKGVKGFSGVTILGDGRISLVLDVPSLIA